MINKDKTLFVCINEYKPLCDGCIYRYPKIISHTPCNFFRADITSYVIRNEIYNRTFRKCGKKQNKSCEINIKFTRI